MLRAVRVILPALCLLAPALPAQATVFQVTKTADTFDGACDQDCSLREAVSAANAPELAEGADVIVVPAGIYQLDRPGSGEDANAAGDLDLLDDTVLVGAGAGSTILDGFFASDRVLHIRSGAEIYGVTIRHGRVDGLGGGIHADPGLLSATLVLHRSVVQGNQAEVGGGIYASSALVLRDSAVLENAARSGGGIAADSALQLTNVTVAGNRAELSGGGLSYAADAPATIAGSTIAFNSAGQIGGGVHTPVLPYLAEEDESLLGSIVAGNDAPEDPDCSREGSLGFNVIGVAGSCRLASTDRTGTEPSPLDAKLGARTGRLGATPVYTLLPGSPALGLVPASSCGSGDQVGQARSVPCEAGAWESPGRLACVPGGPVLCLQEGRFRVTAGWHKNLLGDDARAAPLTDDTGNFWFFTPDNLEVMVKVLNGCGLNQRWWVFTSGLTDVGVSLRVEDLATGRTWEHFSDEGTSYAPVLDTGALECGPAARSTDGSAEPAESAADDSTGSVLLVTKTEDTDDGSCDRDCSLREAVLAANARGRGVILLGPGVHTLGIPGGGENAGHAGDLDVEGGVVILGSGAKRTILDGGGIDRILDVRTAGSLELYDVTVRNGRARPGPHPSDSGAGGGILSSGPLTLVRAWVTGNRSESQGGGIHAFELDARDSTVSGNVSETDGGGLSLVYADLENVTVSGNHAGNTGGGVHLYLFGASFRNVTLSSNTAALGGGLAVSTETCHGPCYERFDLIRTLIAGNIVPAGNPRPDCEGAPPHGGAFNLFGSGNGCSPGLDDLSGVGDPLLGPLGDHGGPTPVHVPLPGSRALDLAPASYCPAADQRGRLRPADGDGDGTVRCDAGAAERLPACQPDEHTLCLGAGDRFQVTASWTARGASGFGKAVPLAGSAGSFWFFDDDNLEVTVKVLDACTSNDRFWVFLSGLTDVGVRVQVLDTATGNIWFHEHAAGTPLQPRLDTNALESCP